ncbi:rhomboid family intramembrane serine protease [Sungkyunkwania multivorans]|uniref:Rhomboid family intramembrane serine protease n=1 Tax=Sungkyunkwania multivorans TaxID=1173618 RepID=A0ABW3CUD6_9FLAO
MFKVTETVKHIIIINVILWIATLLLVNRGIDLSDLLALYYPENENFGIWQILSHMFMHATYSQTGSIVIFHILFNMLGLWMFGSPLEQMWGRNKFLFFYFSAGLGAAALHTFVNYLQFNGALDDLISSGFERERILSLLNNGSYDTRWESVIGADSVSSMVQSFIIPAVGASGAIFGILVAFGMAFPNAELMLIFLPIPIKAKYFIPGILALELFSGITGVSIFSPSNTAYFAHIGGAIVGFLIMWYWRRSQFKPNL